jgi:deoxyribonuclease V
VIAAVDVHYTENQAVAACVTFRGWTAEEVHQEYVEHIKTVQSYEPGNFYKRELPCLVQVLERLPASPSAVIVDGYVWLGCQGTPGLGAHLHLALGAKIPVIGVAKNLYKEPVTAEVVFRGGSKRPLYVTAVGIDRKVAAKHIQEMHGSYRIPTLLKRVDRLCREGLDREGKLLS